MFFYDAPSDLEYSFLQSQLLMNFVVYFQDITFRAFSPFINYYHMSQGYVSQRPVLLPLIPSGLWFDKYKYGKLF